MPPREGTRPLLNCLDTAKVDADSKDNEGRTPLSYAAMNGHEGAVKLLLDTDKVEVGSKDNSAQMRPEQNVGLLLNTLLDIGEVEADSKYNEGRTPLSYAAERGHEAVVKLLVEAQAEVDTKDNSGRTPLSYAAERGHGAVVKLLLGSDKVEADLKDNGRTPVSRITVNGHNAVVRSLMNMCTTLLRDGNRTNDQARDQS